MSSGEGRSSPSSASSSKKSGVSTAASVSIPAFKIAAVFEVELGEVFRYEGDWDAGA